MKTAMGYNAIISPLVDFNDQLKGLATMQQNQTP
jgi:hypothetical protein